MNHTLGYSHIHAKKKQTGSGNAHRQAWLIGALLVSMCTVLQICDMVVQNLRRYILIPFIISSLVPGDKARDCSDGPAS